MTSELPWNAQNLESAARTIGVTRSNLSSALGAESAPQFPFLPAFRKQGVRPIATILLAARCMDMGTVDPASIFPTAVQDPPPTLRIEAIANILRVLLAVDNALMQAPRNIEVIQASAQLAAVTAVALVNALPAETRDRLPHDVLAVVTNWLTPSEDTEDT